MKRKRRGTSIGCRAVRVERVDYCVGSVLPYFALMAPMTPFAMSWCPPAEGCTPSREINVPKVAVGLARFGKGGIAPEARLATNSGFGSQ